MTSAKEGNGGAGLGKWQHCVKPGEGGMHSLVSTYAPGLTTLRC